MGINFLARQNFTKSSVYYLDFYFSGKSAEGPELKRRRSGRRKIFDPSVVESKTPKKSSKTKLTPVLKQKQNRPKRNQIKIKSKSDEKERKEPTSAKSVPIRAIPIQQREIGPLELQWTGTGQGNFYHRRKGEFSETAGGGGN